MLFTLTTTYQPATDLGYLLHKHPARVQTFELPFGHAHVFYPEATAERCTAALVLDVDPIGLVRGKNRVMGDTGLIDSYVNDRPYVASSFLSVAIARVYDSALAGKARERAELVPTPLPLQATLAVVPCRGGENIVRELFEPLGYVVATQQHPLDEKFPEWGASHYFTVTLQATCTVRDLLAHLYVLIPVLDAEKHYFIGDDEVEKLLRVGAGWLGTHPAREKITQRYLKKRRLIHSALARLVQEEMTVEQEDDADADAQVASEQKLEAPLSLHEQRLGAVLAVLKQNNAQRVLDLGCGEGRLLKKLLDDKQFEQIVGVDVSHRALEIAGRRLRLDSLPERQRARIQLLHGALTYRDKRLEGFAAAAIVEVIEHLDPPRLAAFERVVFEFARPRL
ncbi:MAG: 3' terminal RNA ribose 2'-O-methyltransferase Hen1, partial [Chloroflexi bacterium]|nr:3' terminal RNA ribose 2'-O-methyltransferase Hen1 [Chloroflexota bacterium]